MTIADFNALVDAAPAIHPLVETCHVNAARNNFGEQVNVFTRAPKYQPAEVRAAAVLCAVDGFAVAELENGKFATWQPGHVTVAETWDELRGLLNGQEKRWLEAVVAQPASSSQHPAASI